MNHRVSTCDGVAVVTTTVRYGEYEDAVVNTVEYGRNWDPCPPAAELPSRQIRAAATLAGEVVGASRLLLRNRSSSWVAFCVTRDDGSIDFYTVAPDGNGSYYTTTIDARGHKKVSTDPAHPSDR